MKKKKLQKNKKRLIWAGASILTAAILFGVVYSVLIWNGYFGPLPDRSDLAEIRNQQASQIYSSDGRLIGTYYLQNRAEVHLESVNPIVIDALLAIEDVRFYRHNGIDYRALGRVFFKSILLRQDAGGGSTITQQLAKNLYPRENGGVLYLAADKFREMIIARRLENVYSKNELLELYLNTVSFGEDVYGISMASNRFFNKTPAELSIHEAATLTGMLRATSWYNPRRNPESAIQRRNLVISQMERYEFITAQESELAKRMPISTNYNRLTDSEGPAPYFREHLRQEVSRLLRTTPALDGNTYNLYSDGLVIHTTLDSRVQRAAESAVEVQMKNLQAAFNRQIEQQPVFTDRDDPVILQAWRISEQYKHLIEQGHSDDEVDEFLYTPVPTQIYTWNGYVDRTLSPYESLVHYQSFLNTGFLAMHPETGNVLAWVGGVNHDHFKYDHVTSKRQPGSAFKPIVYSAALEYGIEPCDYRRNLLTVYPEYEDWTPRNVRDEYGGRYSVQAALAKSVNTIAVDLALEIGLTNIQQTALKMGIESRIPREPSIALGTAEVSLLELTASYTTFLNNGIPKQPRIITAIYNSAGDLIYDFTDNTDTDAMPAISDQSAAVMVHMLAQAIDNGTGQSLRHQFGITHALAGKTGTTQNFSDGWFIGMTPDLVFGSWVGGSSQRVRFRNNLGYASQTALPIAGHFLNNLGNQSDIPSQRNFFYPHQTETLVRLTCSDEEDDRFRDRLRDFLSGRDQETPRVVETEKEDRSVIRRIRNIFSRDRN